MLRHDIVSRNVGGVSGLTGFAQGGGIWNGVLFVDVSSPLTLDHTKVTRNVLTGPDPLSLHGGGIYTPGYPVTIHASRVAHNRPDQCYGCETPNQ